MDNDSIDGLLKYEPSWRVELVKWREKQTSLLSSTASAAVPSSMVEPGCDSGMWPAFIRVCVSDSHFLQFPSRLRRETH